MVCADKRPVWQNWLRNSFGVYLQRFLYRWKRALARFPFSHQGLSPWGVFFSGGSFSVFLNLLTVVLVFFFSTVGPFCGRAGGICNRWTTEIILDRTRLVSSGRADGRKILLGDMTRLGLGDGSLSEGAVIAQKGVKISSRERVPNVCR